MVSDSKNIFTMKFKIQSVTADQIGNQIFGDSQYNVQFVANSDYAEKDCLTFFTGDNIDTLSEIEAGIILAKSELADKITQAKASAIVFTDDPSYEFVRIAGENYNNTFTGNNPENVSETAKVSENAYIEKNVSIGDLTEIYPFASIYEWTSIGENCRIQSGTTIGGIGLGYASKDSKYSLRFPHLGGVEIGDNVDIGSNSTVVRGILQNTTIGSGTKIGNIVNVGHNVTIGNDCFISSGVTLCGSVKIEDNCWIAPGAVILNKVTIKKNTQVGIGSIISKDTNADSIYIGYPARRIGNR